MISLRIHIKFCSLILNKINQPIIYRGYVDLPRHVPRIIGVIVESILWKMGYLTSDWLLTTFLSRKNNYFLDRNSTGKCLDFVNFSPQDKMNEEKILIDFSSLVFKGLANHGKKVQWTKFRAFGISRNAKFRTQNFAKLRNFAVVENMNQLEKFFGRIFILPTRL